MNLATLTFLTIFLVGCNSLGLIPPENPSLNSYTVVIPDLEKNSVNESFSDELNARKTFNIFRAWNAEISPEKYGLYWTSNNWDLPGKFSLEETYWN